MPKIVMTPPTIKPRKKDGYLYPPLYIGKDEHAVEHWLYIKLLRHYVKLVSYTRTGRVWNDFAFAPDNIAGLRGYSDEAKFAIQCAKKMGYLG